MFLVWDSIPRGKSEALCTSQTHQETSGGFWPTSFGLSFSNQGKIRPQRAQLRPRPHSQSHTAKGHHHPPEDSPTLSLCWGERGRDAGLSGGDESTSTGSSSLILMSGVEGRDMSRAPELCGKQARTQRTISSHCSPNVRMLPPRKRLRLRALAKLLLFICTEAASGSPRQRVGLLQPRPNGGGGPGTTGSPRWQQFVGSQ